VAVVKPVTEQQIRASSLVGVKLLLRATQLEFKRHLVDIGCRQLKYFYDVYNWTSGNTGEAIVALTRMSKKSRINIQSRKFISTVLKGIRHPNIDNPIDVEVLPDSSAICVTRKVYRRGSVRDHLYHSLYHAPFVTKYYKTSPSPFREDDIASIGRQVLEALCFLESQGIPYTHLSAGNVMLTSSGIARLTETENAFLKVERFYEHVFREFAASRQAAFLLADINVLAFGCLLYEMSTAMPIHRLDDLDNTALGLPELTDIIHKIFHADGKDTLVPTLTELLAEPFFARVKLSKAIRTTPEELAASNSYSWNVTEKDILKDAWKSNTKLIYPDDEKAYMATLTNNTSLTSPSHNKSSQLGGFSVVPKPSKVKKARTSKTSSSSSSASSASSLAAAPSPNRPTPPPATRANGPQSGSPAPPPPPPMAPKSSTPPPATPNKNALLNSISGFNASGLKKTKTNDRSAPIL
jgi:serine/threonine protein kinase